MDLCVLSVEEVLQIHETLVAEFAASKDPISPPGVRSMDLLQSAVERQNTNLGGVLKYSDPISNAATLLYGLCQDHPFHNGNKRTALVAMLVHLDKNKLTLFHTAQNDLYDLMLNVASHSLGVRIDRRAKNPKPIKMSADEEVGYVIRWIKDRADRLRRGERQISYRDLKRILERFSFFLERPNNNMIDIVKYADEKKSWLSSQIVRFRKHVGTVGWPGENRIVPVGEIKKVRNICKLREEDGVDSDAFYNETAVIDSFVNRYRTVLRRLAKV